MAGAHDGHRSRMRERFRREGLNGFADHEALELMLFYAIPQRNVNPLAHALLERFGSFHGVLEASEEELCRVEGVGEYAAVLLRLFAAVGRRVEESRAGQREKLRNRMEAQEHCRRLLAGRRQEAFYVVCLDGQLQVLADVQIATGSLSEVAAYPRLVAEAVLRHNAHSVVLCHNHPGGSAVPSQSDLDMTAELAALLSSLEVALADHIIVADGETFSLYASELIQREYRNGEPVIKVASSAGETRIADKIRKKDGRLKA